MNELLEAGGRVSRRAFTTGAAAAAAVFAVPAGLSQAAGKVAAGSSFAARDARAARCASLHHAAGELLASAVSDGNADGLSTTLALRMTACPHCGTRLGATGFDARVVA